MLLSRRIFRGRSLTAGRSCLCHLTSAPSTTVVATDLNSPLITQFSSAAPTSVNSKLYSRYKLNNLYNNIKWHYFSTNTLESQPLNGTVDIPLAQTGEGIAECELLKWFVQEGDQVEEYQPLCEVQSDKATIEITSRYNGTVANVLHAPGDIIKVSSAIAQSAFTAAIDGHGFNLQPGSRFSTLSGAHKYLCSTANKLRSFIGLETPASSTLEKVEYTTLEKYSKDLTKDARDGKLDHVVGRDAEIKRCVAILCRQTKNNVVIVGEAGVGKTALIEVLALKIVGGDVPQLLKNCQLISIDMGPLIAGTGLRGSFEQRFNDILKEAASSKGKVLLFFDEIPMIVGAGSIGGGALDASNLLKPLLGRG